MTKAEELYQDIESDFRRAIDNDMSDADIKSEIRDTYITSLLTGIYDGGIGKQATDQELEWLILLYNKYA